MYTFNNKHFVMIMLTYFAVLTLVNEDILINIVLIMFIILIVTVISTKYHYYLNLTVKQ